MRINEIPLLKPTQAIEQLPRLKPLHTTEYSTVHTTDKAYIYFQLIISCSVIDTRIRVVQVLPLLASRSKMIISLEEFPLGLIQTLLKQSTIIALYSYFHNNLFKTRLQIILRDLKVLALQSSLFLAWLGQSLGLENIELQ